MERTMRAAGNSVKGFSAAVVLAAVAACGGTVDSGGHTASSGPGVVSGAITGTTTVNGLGQFNSYNGQLVFSVTGNSTTGGPNISLNIIFASGTAITAGTYTGASANSVYGTVSQGSKYFQVLGGTQAGGSASGTFTLTITEPGSSLPPTAGDTVYPFVQGTVTATLPGSSGTSDSVTVNATF